MRSFLSLLTILLCFQLHAQHAADSLKQEKMQTQTNPKTGEQVLLNDVNTTPEKKTYKYYSNASLKLDEQDRNNFSFTMEKGKKLVFEYEFRAKESKMVADDEFVERVYFEMPAPKGDKFAIRTEKFDEAKVLYIRQCFCMDRGNYHAAFGSITGKKEGNKWRVNLLIHIDPDPQRGNQPYKKELKGIFIPSKLQ